VAHLPLAGYSAWLPLYLLHGLSETRRNVDPLSYNQSNDPFFDLALTPDNAAEPLHLAFAHSGINGSNLDARKRLDCSLDFRLRRLASYVEDNLIVFGNQGRLLSNNRADDHVVVAKICHLKRSSRA